MIFERCPVVPWSVDTAIAKHPDSYLAYFRGYQHPNRHWDLEGLRYWRTSNSGPGGVTHVLNPCLIVEPAIPCDPEEPMATSGLGSRADTIQLNVAEFGTAEELELQALSSGDAAQAPDDSVEESGPTV